MHILASRLKDSFVRLYNPAKDQATKAKFDSDLAKLNVLLEDGYTATYVQGGQSEVLIRRPFSDYSTIIKVDDFSAFCDQHSVVWIGDATPPIGVLFTYD